MATYRDPYSHQPQYGAESEFNPYVTNQPPHETYDQGGAYDSYGAHGAAPYSEAPFDSNRMQAGAGESTQFGKGLPAPPVRRLNYYGGQRNLWTKGGRGLCVGRFCCCTLTSAVFLIISILLALALWIRPPSVSLGDVNTRSVNGSVYTISDSTLKINLGINVSVVNPNYFSVTFKDIKANLTYPINSTAIGGGTVDNVVFGSHSDKNFTFPFAIEYDFTTADTEVLESLASKCGLTGTSEDITLGIKVLFITVSPTVSSTFTFACPISTSDLESMLKDAGLDLSSLTGSLRRREVESIDSKVE
ncbi:hypothetical protein FISHEDRAFT_62624 [Fistulina hepatica ATCC 64428]|nr:hypothetical protein FISHEDRAFT_62624 [Fistulina hepatica ATCC 64428]